MKKQYNKCIQIKNYKMNFLTTGVITLAILANISDYEEQQCAGGDYIHAEFLKCCQPSTIAVLQTLMAEIWATEICPKDWVNGTVIPLYKKGDTTNCNNYRGITLLSTAGITALPQRNRTAIYVCPRDFIRLGGSCYHFSKTEASWQEAYYNCKDMKSNLTVPERWEDRNIREYMNQGDVERGERWMGGLYDWEAKAWKWGGELRVMKYQSFSRMPRLPPDQLKWHCVAMIPELLYRWSPRVCIEKKFYICQTKLEKKFQKQILRLNNAINEIPLPELGANEVYPHSIDERNNFNNEIMSNNIPNIGNAEYAYRLRNRNNTIIRKRKKLFPGYKRIKGDPEATYLHNVKALRSGNNGLTQAQIEKHLHRLERLRRREEREKRKKELSRNQRNKQRNKNRKNQDSILSAEASNIRSRHIITSKDGEPPSNSVNDNFKGLLSFENVTQRTYTINNKLSMLHPNTIVEIHEIVNKDKQ